LTPIFALVYGVVLLGEQTTITAVVGLALIIVGAESTLRETDPDTQTYS
jgi:drug/metabolite transporter (DMT)-like permease